MTDIEKKSDIGMLKDDSGRWSSMRIMAVVVTSIVLLVWTILCITEKKMVDIPPGVLGLLFTLWLGKVSQKFAEK
jgi:hypothetical protein